MREGQVEIYLKAEDRYFPRARKAKSIHIQVLDTAADKCMKSKLGDPPVPH